MTKIAIPAPGTSASNPLVIAIASAPSISQPASVAPMPGSSLSYPMTIEIASIPSAGKADLPWTAYMQAVATPLVALLAGYVAWRQWKTARDKLKLELFEKRLVIYEAAKELIAAVIFPKPVDVDDLAKWGREIRGAKWLLNEKVEDYLSKLIKEGKQRRNAPLLVAPPGLSEQQAREFFVQEFDKVFVEQNRRNQELDSIFKPFMQLSH